MDTQWVRQNCTKIKYLYQSHSTVSPLPLDDAPELKRNRKLGITINKHSERTSHRFEQPLFFNEWDLDNSFPILFLPVKIQLKVKRIEVEDRGIRIVHQILRRG